MGGNADAGMWAAIGSVGQDDATKLIGRALAAGINFIDTADVYSFGESERLVGQSLRDIGVPRGEVVLATKTAGAMGPKPNDQGASRGHIMDSVQRSLNGCRSTISTSIRSMRTIPSRRSRKRCVRSTT